MHGSPRTSTVARPGSLRRLAPGEVVGIFAPNVPEYAVAFHGVARAGGTNTTVNALYTAEEAAFQLRIARARFLITVPQMAAQARAAARAAGLEEVFAIGEAAGTTPFHELLAPPGTPAPRPAIDPETHVVALPFSSGTTGLSKGVMLTHRNLVANLCQYAPVRDIGEDDRVIAILPFFHIYGQTLVLNDALRRGARIVTLPRFDLALFLAAIEQHGITACYAAPPVVLALAKHRLVDDYDLSSLRFITSGAAPLDAELQGAAQRRVGCRVQQGYGLTEAKRMTQLTAESTFSRQRTARHIAPAGSQDDRVRGVREPDPERASSLGLQPLRIEKVVWPQRKEHDRLSSNDAPQDDGRSALLWRPDKHRARIADVSHGDGVHAHRQSPASDVARTLQLPVAEHRDQMESDILTVESLQRREHLLEVHYRSVSHTERLIRTRRASRPARRRG